ncbi:MAG: hypothetical protein AseanaTS_02110 [Candidatus Pelagadaptatus aseana]|uniref:hypothetical protein n=1 Tax=Candidatus Pelagadaptatus aseana TaxID=3120508 RepID=UPI0039B1FE04
MRFVIGLLAALSLSACSPSLPFNRLIVDTPLDGWVSQYAVVAAKDSPLEPLEAAAVKDIFLRKTQEMAGVGLVPVNILGDPPVRVRFESKVLNMSREDLNRYWITRDFQDLSPPSTQASFEAVRQFVIRVDGALGYIPKAMVTEELKVLHEF